MCCQMTRGLTSRPTPRMATLMGKVQVAEADMRRSRCEMLARSAAAVLHPPPKVSRVSHSPKARSAPTSSACGGRQLPESDPDVPVNIGALAECAGAPFS